MLGTLVKLNPAKRLFALKTDLGYSIFSTQQPEDSKLGDLFDLPDELPLGATKAHNRTRGVQITIEFIAHNASPEQAQTLLFFPE